MISQADYETAVANPTEPAETTDARDSAPAFQPWTSAATAAIAELVKQTKELHRLAAGQTSAPRETAGTPAPPQALSVSHAQESESFPPQDPELPAEDGALQDGAELDEQPETSSEPQVISSGQAPPEAQTENAIRPASPEMGRDHKNRFDAVQSRISGPAQNPDELPELLDQAITLLESVSRHPAIHDYSANKRKLDEIEQRLSYGTYPQ